MKRILSLILALCLLFSLAACGAAPGQDKGEQGQAAEAKGGEPAAAGQALDTVELGYTVELLGLPDPAVRGAQALVHEGEIYLLGTEKDMSPVLAHIPMSGGEWQRAELPELSPDSYPIGLDIAGKELVLLLPSYGPEGQSVKLLRLSLKDLCLAAEAALDCGEASPTSFIVAGDVLVGNGWDGLAGFSLSDGSCLWQREAADFVAEAEGQLYAGLPEGEEQRLELLDPATGEGREICRIPDGHYRSCHSRDGLYLAESLGLMKADPEKGGTEELMQWGDIGIAGSDLIALDFLPEGRMFAASSDYFSGETEFFIISPGSGMERRVLTLGVAEGLYGIYMDEAIKMFNRGQEEYLLRLESYPAEQADKIITQIIAGEGPDMIYLGSSFPTDVDAFTNIELADNMCVDLMPFIETDPDYGPDKFIPGALQAMSKQGHIYGLYPCMSLGSFVLPQKTADSLENWDMDALLEMEKGLGEEEVLLGVSSQEEYIRFLCELASVRFVNYEEGSCSFDQGEFARWLELGKELKWNDYSKGYKYLGYAGMVSPSMGNILGEIEYVGIPGADGPFNYARSTVGPFRILSTCQDKEGAWAFLRTLLSPQVQRKLDSFEEPVMESSFRESISRMTMDSDPVYSSEAMEEYAAAFQNIQGPMAQLGQLAQIISQEAAKYYNGQGSLEDAVRAIQSRAGIFVAERS